MIDIVSPHLDSFDSFLDYGLMQIVNSILPIQAYHKSTGSTLSLKLANPSLHRPRCSMKTHINSRLYPTECRTCGLSYKGEFKVDFNYTINGNAQTKRKNMGGIPIMVKSKACWLHGKTKRQLIALGEENTELGGYFISNGIERLIRMLIVTRRNYVIAIRLTAYQKRGKSYTDAATLVRCLRPNFASQTLRAHYLVDGNVNISFTLNRTEYLLPVGIVVKSLTDITDKEIFDKLVYSQTNSSKTNLDETSGHRSFIIHRVEILLKQTHRSYLTSRIHFLRFLGQSFRTALSLGSTYTDIECGIRLLKDHIFLQISQPEDKLSLLILMIQKLYAFVNFRCCEDNLDALSSHEILLPGQILGKFLLDRLEENIGIIRDQSDLNSENISKRKINEVIEKMPDIGKKFEYFINTGNFLSRSGIELQQTSGFTVVLERINYYRFISYFRSVHRGSYYSEIRTTGVRRLLPESWGFICPVQTPDGTPCGLLNHLSACSKVIGNPQAHKSLSREQLLMVLLDIGIIPISRSKHFPVIQNQALIILDGIVVGSIHNSRISALELIIREQKKESMRCSKSKVTRNCATMVPWHLELACIPCIQNGPYPGVFIHTEDARIMRPVLQLPLNEIEFVGTLEQQFMDISCPDNSVSGSHGLRFTHTETSPRHMLSIIAGMTIYSDCNQSPRNMYQCQMCKQTIGTQSHNLYNRCDIKTYELQSPQNPIALTEAYEKCNANNYPNGLNAVVAVIANTGYDMEDAAIIKKSSMELGFACSVVHKTEIVDLKKTNGKTKSYYFTYSPEVVNFESPGKKSQIKNLKRKQNIERSLKTSSRIKHLYNHDIFLDSDGLPCPGTVIYPGDAMYSYKDKTTKNLNVHYYHGEDVGSVEQVGLIYQGDKNTSHTKAWIKTRVNRNPLVGDKFASRAGQKGVLSKFWADVDMPYCVKSGIRPDLLINPNAFPSRMTIAMLKETLVSKVGAMNGVFVDSSPFQFVQKPINENNPLENFGNTLENRGFLHHGGEVLISGTTGEEFAVDIFIGLVYYQRLRQMVSDKFQARSSGPIDQLTHQPLKGGRNGGGIRFGEMERDSLIAHGAAFILHDRLHASSDICTSFCCRICGSILSPWYLDSTSPNSSDEINPYIKQFTKNFTAIQSFNCVKCKSCGSASMIDFISIPYVFRFLAIELAAMNIKLKIDIL